MLELKDFVEAKKRLENALMETYLIYSPYFSNEYGNEVYLKPENLQRTGSFKIRGAYNKIAKLTPEQKKLGLIASSAGNHAQGVAYSAKENGVSATICMPIGTPLIKIEATESYGAKVVTFGEVYDDAYQKATELQEEFGYTFIHPFDDIDVIEGQGTIGLEIYDDLKDVDIVIVPIGGGGLISGVACALKQINPNIKIVGVEPEGAASAIAAIQEDQIIALREANTIADGTAVKQIGSTTFDYIKAYVDEIITVSDYEIMETFLMLVEKHKLVAEPSGILSIVATKKLKEKNKKVVCVVSGGNIDVLAISSMIQKGLVARARIVTISIFLPNKPGELMKVSTLLTSLHANVVQLEHNQFRNLSNYSEVELRVTVETNGEHHKEEIVSTFKKEGFNVEVV